MTLVLVTLHTTPSAFGSMRCARVDAAQELIDAKHLGEMLARIRVGPEQPTLGPGQDLSQDILDRAGLQWIAEIEDADHSD